MCGAELITGGMEGVHQSRAVDAEGSKVWMVDADDHFCLFCRTA